MEIYLFVFINLVISCVQSKNYNLQLKKCCPHGQYLDVDFQCTNEFDLKDFPNPQENVNLQLFPINNFEGYGLPKCKNEPFAYTCNYKIKIDTKEELVIYTPNQSLITERIECRNSKELDVVQSVSPEDACQENTIFGPILIYCPCDNRPCIRKCCPADEIFNEDESACTVFTNESQSSNTIDNFLKKYSSIQSENVHILTNAFPPACKDHQLLKLPFEQHTSCSEDPIWRNTFAILPDGRVQIKKYELPFSPTAYCFQDTYHEGNILIMDNLLICSTKRARPLKFDINGGLLLMGGFILLLTVLLSSYVPELRDTLYLKVTLCHNIALMVASFTWGITNFLPAVTYPLCLALSLTIYITFIASFFWMNVMCIDIAIAFRHLRSVYRKENGKTRTFLWYSLYGWGTPFLLTCFTTFMELAPDKIKFLPRPGFGCKNCGFNPETYALLLYFYGPMIFILILNLALSSTIIYKIFKIQKQTSVLKTCERERSTLKYRSTIERCTLFGKMFILMGLTWSTEIISWVVGGPNIYWYLPDTINFLRSIFVFIIFICKKSVWSALMTARNRQRIPTFDHIEKSRSSKCSSIEIHDYERRVRILPNKNKY